jgi:ceramide glucosyltransferase
LTYLTTFLSSPASWAVYFSLALLILHITSTGIAASRCRLSRPARPRSGSLLAATPRVSIVRPVCGIDNFVADTLASSFCLDYPDFEILFCITSADDPAVELVRRLIASHPSIAAKLLIGDDRISANPKLNNCVKGWKAARHEWIVLADCNVMLPPDFLRRMLAAWRADTGLVCSTPIGARPEGFWAELECAFLNTYQAKWQYVSETIGLGFAQGKTMLWQRRILEQAGGIRALAGEIAEDAAATKVVRAAGLHVQLVDHSFEQPLGRRRMGEVWARQVRWARLRRATFPVFFLPEIFAGSAFPVVAAAFAAVQADLNMMPIVALFCLVWYGAEAILAYVAGWHASMRMIAANLLRDCLLPILWIGCWLGDDFVWRGTDMTVSPGTVSPGAVSK